METPLALPYEILSTFLDPRRIEEAAANCETFSFPHDQEIRARVIDLMRQMSGGDQAALRAYDELVPLVGVERRPERENRLKTAHRKRQQETLALA